MLAISPVGIIRLYARIAIEPVDDGIGTVVIRDGDVVRSYVLVGTYPCDT